MHAVTRPSVAALVLASESKLAVHWEAVVARTEKQAEARVKAAVLRWAAEERKRAVRVAVDSAVAERDAASAVKLQQSTAVAVKLAVARSQARTWVELGLMRCEVAELERSLDLERRQRAEEERQAGQVHELRRELCAAGVALRCAAAELARSRAEGVARKHERTVAAARRVEQAFAGLEGRGFVAAEKAACGHLEEDALAALGRAVARVEQAGEEEEAGEEAGREVEEARVAHAKLKKAKGEEVATARRHSVSSEAKVAKAAIAISRLRDELTQTQEQCRTLARRLAQSGGEHGRGGQTQRLPAPSTSSWFYGWS